MIVGTGSPVAVQVKLTVAASLSNKTLLSGGLTISGFSVGGGWIDHTGHSKEIPLYTLHSSHNQRYL